MDLFFLTEHLIALAGETGAAALGGLAIGMVFGIAAQQSRFCLRAATVEFGRDCLKAGLRPGGIGPRSSVWLLKFGTALFWTQALRVAEIGRASCRERVCQYV